MSSALLPDLAEPELNAPSAPKAAPQSANSGAGWHLIQVRTAPENSERPEALSILQQLLPVGFDFSSQRAAQVAGELFIGLEPESRNDRADVATLSVPAAKAIPAADDCELSITFSDHAEVPFPFRGRSLRTRVGRKPRSLSLCAGEQELARTSEGPVWGCSQWNGAKHFRSAFPIPEIQANGNLNHVLKGERFLEMLPVLHWLRVICASTAPQGPPLRAGFMFDDPNLHWPTYGHVDFAEMARHAKREHYHVSFATIPLDTWFTHKAAARIFADNPEQLSLLIHGNNHINSEMGREYTAEARAALMAQAIRRMERFERRTGLPVSRVMVAPGGICWEDMIAVLPEQRYEAACISHGSLRAHNKAKPWTKKLGLLPSEIIRGCPVLPRWALSNDLTNTILLAAYLNQAIILRGHQQDVKAGLEILDQAARFINSLGPVQWSDMTSLARRNYQWRQEGKVLRLLPMGRKLSISVPEGAEELLIECPPEAGWERWQVRLADGARLEVRAGESLALPAGQAGTSVQLETTSVAFASTETPGAALLAFAVGRRFLTEARDRWLSSS